MIGFLKSRTSPLRQRSHIGYRTGSLGTRSKPRHFLPWVETLEQRTLLATGIFIENFSADVTPLDPNLSGYDSAQDGFRFQHSKLNPEFANGTPANGSAPDATFSQPHHFFLIGADTITFPDVAADEFVALAKVNWLGEVTIRFVGASGNVLTFSPPTTFFEIRSVSATNEAISDNGQPLGPIRSIQITGFESYFDDITVLVLSNRTLTAEEDTFTIPPNRTARLDVLQNDRDPDGDSLEVTAIGAPGHGTAVVNQFGDVDYTPQPGFVGVDRFNYTISDNRGSSDTATVTVTVNTPPSGRGDHYDVVHGFVGPYAPPIGLLNNDPADSDGDLLQVVEGTNGQFGAVTFSADGGFTYSPTTPGGRLLSDDFTYRLTDGFYVSDPNHVGIAVENQRPLASSGIIAADHGDSTPLRRSFFYEDRDGDPVTATVVEHDHPEFASINLTVIHGRVDVEYRTLSGRATGPDRFTYRLSDVYSESDTYTVEIQVDNEAPVALDRSYSGLLNHASLGQPVSGLFPYRDDDGDLARATVVGQPRHGTVSLSPDGSSFVYQMRSGIVGDITNNQGFITESFTFKVNDGHLDSNVATVSFDWPNNPPEASDVSYFLTTDEIRNGIFAKAAPGLLIGARDVDGDQLLTERIVTPPTHGTVRFDFADGSFVYQAFDAFSEFDDSFTFAVTDHWARSVPATVHLRFRFQEETGDDEYSVSHVGATTVAAETGVLANDFDKYGLLVNPSDPRFSVSVRTSGEGGQTLGPLAGSESVAFDTREARVVFFADGSFSYTPTSGVIEGNDDFYYEWKYAGDGIEPAQSGDGSVSIQITNRAPVAHAGGPYVLFEGNSLTFDGSASFDPDGDALTYQWDTNFSVHPRGVNPTLTAEELASSHLPDPINHRDVILRVSDGFKNAEAPATVTIFTDGIENHREDAGPNAGDGNYDGILDSRQGNVASVPPPGVFFDYVTLVSPAGTTLVGVTSIELSNLPPPPSEARFPLGVVAFTLMGLNPGQETTVTIIPEAPPRLNTYYKYGPEPDDLTTIEDETVPHWYEFLFDGTTGAQFFDANGQIVAPHSNAIVAQVVLHFIDGERGDSDLLENGVIIDPGGPATIDDLPLEPLFTLSSIDGSRVAVPGQLRSYSATFSGGNQVGNYAAAIDWGDGNVSDGYVAVASAGGVTNGTVSFWHTYKTIGDRVVRLTLRDGNGNVRTTELPVTVQLVAFQPDPLDSTRRSLVVGGFDLANDQIVFQPDAGGVRLSYNGYNVGPFAFDGSIMAFGQGGDDTIRVDQRLTQSAVLFGQDGNDILVGGAGTNVLVGGVGNDQLFGFAARDLLFGGLGADVLNGHGPSPTTGDSDLLCSDYAAAEYDPSLLASLHSRWQSPASYEDRLHNLRYAASPALNNTTVFDDYSADRLIGGAGMDWFVFSALDQLVDVEDGEQGLGVVLRPRRR
jgi:Ca2+-binding RTX toxin-like protein